VKSAVPILTPSVRLDVNRFPGEFPTTGLSKNLPDKTGLNNDEVVFRKNLHRNTHHRQQDLSRRDYVNLAELGPCCKVLFSMKLNNNSSCIVHFQGHPRFSSIPKEATAVKRTSAGDQHHRLSCNIRDIDQHCQCCHPTHSNNISHQQCHVKRPVKEQPATRPVRNLSNATSCFKETDPLKNLQKQQLRAERVREWILKETSAGIGKKLAKNGPRSSNVNTIEKEDAGSGRVVHYHEHHHFHHF